MRWAIRVSRRLDRPGIVARFDESQGLAEDAKTLGTGNQIFDRGLIGYAAECDPTFPPPVKRFVVFVG